VALASSWLLITVLVVTAIAAPQLVKHRASDPSDFMDHGHTPVARMNFLAHGFCRARPRTAHRGVLGDFVKARTSAAVQPRRCAPGIHLHRAIDRYTMRTRPSRQLRGSSSLARRASPPFW